ncbi:hypothetical protein BGW38_000921 [Lunasporangiospora selenospora]|uniref:Uncharacterized protein n=1 Tax=Lunasporangiospora selenospora TaxID=979761 RepID=A0A9P6FU55_9FUNG|nr:hypothetical protein BGW38_000921 [Lunasporangiospora selenospora]
MKLAKNLISILFLLWTVKSQAPPQRAQSVAKHRIQVQALPYIPPPSISPDEKGNQIPDFSNVGYREGAVPLPVVPVKIILEPSTDHTVDDRQRIQDAIDKVGQLPMSPLLLRDGKTKIQVRGAVLLKAGVYRVNGTLILNQSGVVLRGEGNHGPDGPDGVEGVGTVIVATGKYVHDFIYINGLLNSKQGTPESILSNRNYRDGGGESGGSIKDLRPKNYYRRKIKRAIPLADEYIPSGSLRIPVKDITNFQPGTEIIVERLAKQAWMDMIGMGRFAAQPGTFPTTLSWETIQFNFRYFRKVTRVEKMLSDQSSNPPQTSNPLPPPSPPSPPPPPLTSPNLGDTSKAPLRRRRVPNLLPLVESNSEPRIQQTRHRRRLSRRGLFDPDGFFDTSSLPARESTPYSGDDNWSDNIPDGDNDFADDDDEEDMPRGDRPSEPDDPAWVPGYLHLNIPTVMDMDPTYGPGEVFPFEYKIAIPSDIGVENIALYSVFDRTVTNSESNPLEDENHAWFAVVVDHCENCWVADVRTRYFVSGINLAPASKHVTVQDCEITEPISTARDGGRRYMYLIKGQMGLVKRCFASDARHDFITGAKTRGPNVFVDSTGIRANNDAGPHNRWSMGTLYDNIHSRNLNVRNRGWIGAGQGWCGVNHVIYRCSTDVKSRFQSPPGGSNWVIGFEGALGDQMFEFEGRDATMIDIDSSMPRSLYWAQLVKRLGGTEAIAVDVEGWVGVAGKNKYPPKGSVTTTS